MNSSTPLLKAYQYIIEIHGHKFNTSMYGFQGIFMAHYFCSPKTNVLLAQKCSLIGNHGSKP